MKRINTKLSMTMLSALCASTSFAQSIDKSIMANPVITVQQPVQTVNTNQPANTIVSSSSQAINGAALAGTDFQSPDSGNAYEKEVTPLLREISRKKAILEVKKLNAELEKMDAEMAKLKKEESNPTPTNTNGKMINVQDLTNAPFVPNMPPQSVSPQNIPNMNIPIGLNTPVKQSDIKVLMTYGYTNNLFAKITSGSQGGYVVKRGDILPNGQEVVNITSNYIEVKKVKGKGKFEKIFVTGPEPIDTSGKPISTNNMAQKLPL